MSWIPRERGVSLVSVYTEQARQRAENRTIGDGSWARVGPVDGRMQMNT